MTVNEAAATHGVTAKANSLPVTGQDEAAVSPTIVPPPTIIDGLFKVRFVGVPGRTYTIEWSASVKGPWTKAVNVTAPVTDAGFGSGVFEFSEAVSEMPSRFDGAYHPFNW